MSGESRRRPLLGEGSLCLLRSPPRRGAWRPRLGSAPQGVPHPHPVSRPGPRPEAVDRLSCGGHSRPRVPCPVGLVLSRQKGQSGVCFSGLSEDSGLCSLPCLFFVTGDTQPGLPLASPFSFPGSSRSPPSLSSPRWKEQVLGQVGDPASPLPSPPRGCPISARPPHWPPPGPSPSWAGGSASRTNSSPRRKPARLLATLSSLCLAWPRLCRGLTRPLPGELSKEQVPVASVALWGLLSWGLVRRYLKRKPSRAGLSQPLCPTVTHSQNQLLVLGSACQSGRLDVVQAGGGVWDPCESKGSGLSSPLPLDPLRVGAVDPLGHARGSLGCASRPPLAPRPPPRLSPRNPSRHPPLLPSPPL